MLRWTVLVVLLACAAAQAGAQQPAKLPAFACAQVRDYWGNVSTSCAPANCSAQQRNLGGDTLVLDLDSFSMVRQGYQHPIPATCCQACKDLDGCNAWNYCSKPEGCGSGCSSYVKAFKDPIPWDAPLPLKMFGNFKGCSGDRWPPATCSLKFIKDTKNPPVTPNGAAEGWVSGIVPKPTNLDKRCAPGTSAKTCTTCLATRDPTTCLTCQATANRLYSLNQCKVCANIQDPAARAACVRCVAPGKGKPATQCHRCTYAGQPDLNKVNMSIVTSCFTCAAKAAASIADTCPQCFEQWQVGSTNQAACSARLVQSTSNVAAAAAAPCYNDMVKDKQGCLACAAKAKSTEEAVGCGACANAVNIRPEYMSQCRDCVFKAPVHSKSYCYNTMTRVPVSPAATAALTGYYSCLAKAKTQDYSQGCMFCYRDAVESPGADGPSCYACVNVMPIGFNANSCSSCWSASRKAKGKTCQACVAAKPNGTYAFDCYGGK